MFAANKYIYSRYGLYYVRSMTWLGPEILDRFCQGQQSLHHTAGIYNGQWSDMFIETNWTKKGRGPGGIIGMKENPQTMASWVYSMDATMTLTGDLKKMSGDDANVQTTHKEEAESRINRNGHDRQSLRAALESRIDPMDPVTHAAGCLINISNDQIAQPNFNADRALEIGREQMKQFEASYPDGFYNTLSKQVVTFAERKQRLSVGESAIVDQEAIYARVTTVSQRLLTSPTAIVMDVSADPNR